MSSLETVAVAHFSDVLCIWAYCAQIRIDELRKTFGANVVMSYRYVPVFGNTATKIGQGWANRGGFSAYAQHVQSIAQRFPHVQTHLDVWETIRPASSSSPHLFLKAVQLIEGHSESPSGGLLEQTAWALRLAFFRDARDIAQRNVQMEIAEQLGVPRDAVESRLDNGQAIAALFEDVDIQQQQKIEGSPTLVFNAGRQKLYGNVGYRVIEANIAEVLRSVNEQVVGVEPRDAASWC